ncbi:hypothetical protein M407DRAFT_245943 [Tulasnella calospora MUT 4182]|uniref:C2H2-type domain-containing protein n=1 Tax=Tulasnella calospora MUT 4182 TaxID=1051891 RepID=A0A0C3PY40_9AGAM|nr:hypothetical protein M407DRAFT_245943 [Tulasnella calospora MUT 4182]
MPSCQDCGKSLATAAGLRRHINSQHAQSEWHACECGRSFLDPAGRSRCRTGHSKSFACSAWGCDYRSGRKDAVKQHIRRRHRGLVDLQVLTLPANFDYSWWLWNTGLAAEIAPAPSDLILSPPAVLQPQVSVAGSSLSPSPPSYPQTLPESWGFLS